MSRTETTVAVVFADISGSTRLYETLGNAVAQDVVRKCLALMAAQVGRYDGTVIKTIGDEIVCTFSSAESAVDAAIAIQEDITENPPVRNMSTPEPSIRIGLDFGSAIVEGSDVFGDVVNVAARMAGIARGGQIITTAQAVNALTTLMQAKTRHLDRIPIKGKSAGIDIFEVIWQEEDVTRMAPALFSSNDRTARLRLSYNGQDMYLDLNTKPIMIGRSIDADIVVRTSYASRNHARIEFSRGKFILTDMSTNGTNILTSDGPVYLRRDSFVLEGIGEISLGQNPDQTTEIVTFECE